MARVHSGMRATTFQSNLSFMKKTCSNALRDIDGTLYHGFVQFPNRRTMDIRHSHARMNYVDMLSYGANIPHALCCIVITERTIPIRHPLEVYRIAMGLASKCVVDPSCNVCFHTRCPPVSLPKLARGKTFQLMNNKAQALFSVSFLKEALPTLRTYCSYFGLEYSGDFHCTVNNHRLFEQWERCTGAMADEFWLLNSYLLYLVLQKHSERPLA